ncbi:MAG: Circadian input kinase A [Nitrospira sp.]|jgi:PAS domain S-box-containing protein|nr:Circadian input kinase A [Nitrospira sp.]
MEDFPRNTTDDASAQPPFTDFGAWDWDIISGDVQWFGAHERLIGMRTKSLSGKVEAFSHVLHPDDRARVWKKVLGAMARRETQYSDQFRFLYSNGTVRWVSGTGRFYYDDGGRPVRMAGVVQDVTVVKRREQALRDSEERFASAFRSSPHPIGITEAATGRCLEVNDACLQLFGFDREEVIGNTTLMLGIWPKQEDRSRLVERLKAGEPVRNLELSFRTKSGDVRHILVSSDLVELNGTLCLITVGNDITERKHAEQALRENEAWQSGQKEAFQAVMNGASLEDSLRPLVRTAVRYFGGDARAAFYRVRDDGVTLGHVVGMSEAYARSVEGFKIGKDSLSCGLAMYQVAAVITPDVTQDPRWRPWLWLAQEHRFRASWSFPVRATDGPALGTLALYFNEPRQPTVRDLELVDVLTHAATIIISRHQESSERARVEHILRESEARFRTMAEAVPSFLFETDAAGWTTWTSQDWCRFTGQTPEQVAGHGWAEALHPEDRAPNLDRWLHCVEKGMPFESQQRVRRTDGTYAWVIAKALPVRDDPGTIRRWVGSVTDVNAFVRAEEQLRENHRFISEMASVLPGVLYIFDLQEQRNVYVNRHAGVVLGYSPEEVHALGADFIPTVVHPDDAIRLLRHFEGFQELEEGVSVQVEYRFRHRDGSYRWFLSRDIVWQRNAEGQVRQILGIATDITERKQVENQLRESEERLRLALDGADLGSWDVDWLTGTTVWDRRHAAMQGYKPQTGPVSLERWRERMHPDDRGRHTAAIEWAKRERGLFAQEHRICRADTGELRWLSLHGRFSYNDAGEPVRFSGVSLDVTERKLHEQRQEFILKLGDALRPLSDPLEIQRAAMRIVGETLQADRVLYADMTPDGETWIVRDNYTSGRVPKLVGSFPTANFDAMVETLKRGEVVVIPDVNAATELREADKRGFAGLHARSAIVIPLVKGGRWLSNLGVHHAEPRQWNMEEITLLQETAERTWAAVERTRAEEALREAHQRLQRWNVELEQTVNMKTAELMQSQTRLRALAGELSLAEQRERKRLATELHDHLQQMLVYGKMTIGQGKRRIADVPAAAEMMTKVDEVLSEALTYSRTLVAELSPPVLHDYGLAAGFKWLGEHLRKYNLTVTVLVPEHCEPDLPEAHRVLLFQSVRELLINASKHAGTDKATVLMQQRDDSLRVTVSDEGKGFDLAAAEGTPGGEISSKFGLFSIRERMRALGGSFDIQSAPGRGTTAMLVLPLARSAEPKVVSPALGGTEQSIHPASGPPQSAPPKNAVTRVLLVDDHTMVRQGLRSVLDAYDDIQVVGEARDGEEAVQLVKELRPRVVVMDINMPRMNGVEATRHIKSHWPETLVIGISVNAGDDNGIAMKRVGAAVLLTKEAAVDDLYRTIQDTLNAEANV